MALKGKTEKYVISSPLEGVLLQNGMPLPDTRLIRRLSWNGNDSGIAETFMTDADGRFSLPVHEEELSLGMLVEFVGKTWIYVASEKEENLIWYSPKRSPEIYSDIHGPLAELTCDVDAPEMVLNTNEWYLITRCRWKGMPA